MSDPGRGNRRGRGGGRGRGRGRGIVRGRSDRYGGDHQAESQGSNTRNISKPQRPVKLGFKSLLDVQNKHPNEIVLDLTSNRCFPATEELIKDSPGMGNDMIILLVSVLAKACDCDTKEFLLKLLNLLPRSKFLTCHLVSYLNRLERMTQADLGAQIKNIIKLFSELLRTYPNCYDTLPLLNLRCATEALSANGQLDNDGLKIEVERLMALRDEKIEELERKEKEKLERRRRPQRMDAAVNDTAEPPEDFRQMSIIPSRDDIYTREQPFLRRNIVHGRYRNSQHYLDVQFRLLREDFIRPLREGIQGLLERQGSEKSNQLQDIRIYKDVRIRFPICSGNGLVYQIEFNNSRFRGIRWENSKRLIYGSLLCLSKDNFESFILATVENRDVKKLKEGLVDIKFVSTADQLALDGGDVYQMVETTAYFEAYRHVLEGLRETKEYSLPFQRYIVECANDVQPPAYLRNRMMEAVTFDLTPIMKKEDESVSSSILQRLTGLQISNGEEVPILNTRRWPSARQLELDDSQLEAVKMALTKEFSVIQGPPGTGKTYIGLKIVKVLLHNKSKWDHGSDLVDLEEQNAQWDQGLRQAGSHRPILVVCYTNHALDQFLEGIHRFHPTGIIRIGGRSTSEIMQECNLRTLKKKRKQEKTASREVRRALYDIHSELEVINEEMQRATDSLRQCLENIVHEQELNEAGIMTDEQHASLLNRVGVMGKRSSAMLKWLNLINSGIDLHETNPDIPPVAVFPFSWASRNLNVITRENAVHVSEGVKKANGIGGDKQSALELQGRQDSFIEIPNSSGRPLDTKFSITVLAFVYPMGNIGPILSYGKDGVGIQIWQRGVEKGKGVLMVILKSRDLQVDLPVATPVMELNTWNYIGVSYDYKTTIVRLWHDGNEVERVELGVRIELATQFPIRMGALDNRDFDQLFFRGRIASLKIYGHALGLEQIRLIGGLPEIVAEDEQDEPEEENTQEEEEEDNEDVTFEGDALQDMRLLDVEEVIVRPKILPRRGKLRLADPFATLKEEFDLTQAGGWRTQQNPKKLAHRIEQKIARELSSRDMLSEIEASAVRDVWRLHARERWRLYRRWAYNLTRAFKETIANHQVEFERGARKLNEVRSLEDLEILKNADVIGMTTTGAAKFRNLLQRIQPRITVVEEAAEVLESHIVTSLTPGCQHLILIGDHQQLRPNPTVYKLAKDYSLDVSLFERMVKNEMPYRRLTAQHRMRPEIAELMKHIYEDLQNHESVIKFDNIKGVSSNIFFIDHREYEDYVEEGRSRTNVHEAKYIAALCRYLILQGYERSQITVLTMYTGQLIQMKHYMPKDFFRGVRISAVDNFQGEENDIVILSLVRSNDDGKIGFLKIENRICVALSRAKKGFFCIGNLDLMTEQSDLWSRIVEDMRAQGNLGTALILTCQNHPYNKIQATCDQDFRKAPEGGCHLPCGTRLDCGHVCEKVCHPTDPGHLEYKCRKPCQKPLCELGHKCNRFCYQECGPCMITVYKRLPDCGHVQQVPCSVSPREFSCRDPCRNVLLKCGHKCQALCGEKCTETCKEKVPKKWPCGHINNVECHVDPQVDPCTAPCGTLLKCEHTCKGTCNGCRKGRVHINCRSKCGRTLFCGHICEVACTRQCPPCSQPCANYCVHSKCNGKCGEPCKPCTELCKWKCPHFRCTKLCGELCDRPRCNEPCNKHLQCGHPCIGLCGEKCPIKCRECHRDEVTEVFFGSEDEEDARFIELSDCGHIFEVEALDQWMDMAKANDDGKAVGIQLKECPKCKTQIRTSLRYGNIIKTILADFEKVKRKYYLKEEVKDEKVEVVLGELDTFSDCFERETSELRRYLNHKNLTAEQLNMVENQINFLKLLMEIKLKIESELDDQRQQYPDKLIKMTDVSMKLKSRLNSEVELVMKKRARFSEQELEEIHGELTRFLLLVSYTVAQTLFDAHGAHLSSVDAEKMKHIQEALQSEKTIDTKRRERYMARLKGFMNGYLPRVVYKEVTRDEKDMIVKAMGLNQGHWFKCPNGHVYCITECGGAMEEANCPECGKRIGGQSHALRQDNRLARDMDGAAHAAWSNFTNLNNFDLRDLR